MKRPTICIATATRAEYGLLKPLLRALEQATFCSVRLVVTGAHLSAEFGHTDQEIEQDGFHIDEKIDMLLSGDSPSAISKSMGLALIGFADYFQRTKPDALILLGDRYETLAIGLAAMNEQIPIVHLHGGETTEGAVDEAVRHALTKLSYLHFTSTETHRQRVIQLGEAPDRVYNVGALGVENVRNTALMTRAELAESLGIPLDQPIAVLTFHPVTLEAGQAEQQIQALLNACAHFPDLTFLITKANADTNGRVINQFIDAYCEEHDHAHAFHSLGLTRYLSALNEAVLVIGNSSSGIIEAPSFGIPSINIGNRQKGRTQAASVLNCEPDTRSIVSAIQRALDSDFRSGLHGVVNPYGDGKTSERMVAILQQVLCEGTIELKKPFYDLEGTNE